jgi:ATP-dependent RNA helicase RhlB
MLYKELNLEPRLLSGITERGYTELTDVQEKTLFHTLKGKDAAVQSQTGTGKTAAFLITLFERMLRSEPGERKAGLIIVPTRELAVQVEKEAQLLNRHIGFKCGSLYGGTPRRAQRNRLAKGLDIVVGTPGRLLDFGSGGELKLKDVGFLVIDEADRLFDMGFLPDIKRLLGMMPSRGKRQTMLFSATLDRAARMIVEEHLVQPVTIEVTPGRITVDTISQEIYNVKSHIKLNLMLGILKSHNPRSALIFANTRHGAFRLARKLQLNGFQCRHLTGDLPQSRRLDVIAEFKAGDLPILVATDVAARGLQIDDLDLVINYDIPQDCEGYVHRIGRTARAGKHGKAITLASEGTFIHLMAIEDYIGMKIPVKTADLDMYAIDRSEGKSLENRSRKASRRNGRPGTGRKRRRGARLSTRSDPSKACASG